MDQPGNEGERTPCLGTDHRCGYQQVLECSPDGVVVFDRTGRTIYCNERFVAMTGAASRESVLTALSRDFYAHPDRDLKVVMGRLHAEGGVTSHEVRVPDSWRPLEWVDLSIRTVEIDGETCYVASVRDVGPRRKLERERERMISLQQVLNEMILEGSLDDVLRESCARLADLYDVEQVGIALLRADPDGEHFRYEQAHNVAPEVMALRIPVDPARSLTAYAAEHGYAVVDDYQTAASDGIPRIAEIRSLLRAVEAVALRDRRNQLVGVLTLFSDAPGSLSSRENEISLHMAARHLANIIEAKRLEDEIRLLGITDSLTGLYNARYFYRRLDEEMQRSLRSGQPLTVLLADLDNYKEYNDRAGHVAGDHLLRHVGEIVRGALRSGNDSAFRYGGDELVALLPETDVDRARQVALRICARVRAVAQAEGVTVSIGLAEYRGEASPEELVRRADRAMYQAKGAGKDRVAVDRPHHG